MPFPNEHAARQKEPGLYNRFSRGVLPGAAGISAIFGFKPNGKSEIQSLRFDRRKWTVDRARAWLKQHGFKSRIEPASSADDTPTKRTSFKGVV